MSNSSLYLPLLIGGYLVIGLGAWAGVRWIMRRPGGSTNAAAAMPAPQPTRRVRAGPPADETPRCLEIARLARAAARHDFRVVGRPRGNPFDRHSKAFVAWAIDYTATWQDLANATAAQAGQQVQP